MNLRDSAKMTGIILTACLDHNVTLPQILGESRKQYICKARFEAMAEIKKNMPLMPLQDIAEAFNRKDHSSVIHAIKRHEQLTEI